MKNALKWLLSPVVLGSLAVLALSLLLWWIGPLVALGSGSDVWRPLDGFWARVVVLALLWLAWLGRLGWLAWRRRRANALLAQGAAAGPSASDVEAQALAQRFQAAVSKLQAAPGAAGRSWLSGRRDGLYELPWYMFIGAPGSGKTTALLNAGLNFVLSDPAGGGAGAPAAVKGVGGTRNCDWFFTQDAVLIDTAGRYTLQQSDASVDAAAWDKFLALLRQTRPRRPINGVLLTVNVQDLLQQSAAERSDHADRLRTRLQELQTKLGVRAPVYVLVTKTDLIAGFTETFDALGKEGRDQVWGFSFDQAAPAAGEAALQDFDARYRALEERLVAGQIDRLQAERDVARRAAIFGFPQEFASLRPLLGGFLRQVFGAGAGLQDAVLLRGVYFTSGTQEGTPIDRVMGLLARSFGLERRTAALVGQHGKSFFLRRLLQDLVFAEAHLVSANPQAERRRLLLRGAGFAALAVAATAVLVGWAVSHARNQAHVDLTASRLPALKQALEALPPATSADPAPLAQPLAAVRRAAQPDGFALDAPPLLHTLGLYQGDKLDAGARLGYQRLLRHALLPRVAKRLEERLRAANKDNLEQAYEALKAYRMLYTPAQFDADALKAWITLDWDSQLASLPPDQRSALDGHLDALLALGAPQSGVQQDTALVAGVRDMLASYPLEYRIYSRLRRQHRNAVPELALGAMAGPLADKVLQRVSGEPLARGVPGLYTRAGYAKAFQGSLAATAAQLAGEAQWVLDQPADATAGAAGGARAAAAAALSDALPLKVRRLYLQDYIVVWDKLLADVRLIDLKGQPLSAVADMARVLAGADSPLAAFYRAVAAETSLVPAAPAGGAGLAGAAASAAEQAKSALRSLADPTPAAPSAGPVEKMVDDHFAPIRRLVAGQPSPLDDMAKAFAAVQAQLQAVDAAQKSKSAPPPPGGGAGAKAAVAQAPEPVRKMVDSMVDIAERGGHAALTGTMTGELKPVYDFCTRAIANRYPFATSSAADVLPDDFGQFFGPGGQLDAFFQARLASLVDTSGAVWTYKPGLDGSRPAAPAALADFQRAARIREAFFRSGGRVPGFRLDIKAGDLGGLPEVVLDIDGQVSKLTANGPPVTVAWPSTRVASQVSLSGGTGSGNITTSGPWALFRLFDRFDVQPGAQPEKFAVTVTLDGKRARLDVTANSVFNPFRLREVQQFRCPGAL